MTCQLKPAVFCVCKDFLTSKRFHTDSELLRVVKSALKTVVVKVDYGHLSHYNIREANVDASCV